MNKLIYPTFSNNKDIIIHITNVKARKYKFIDRYGDDENYSKLLEEYIKKSGNLIINENIEILKRDFRSYNGTIFCYYELNRYEVKFNENVNLLEQHNQLLNHIENYLTRVNSLESFK